ncbi:MAG: HEAT repeat domain-containing protein [Prevotellaceae bacterium]|jgi:hypothetical protein|nr:HEAT repeat domain-containing protein [Prevotellaceae bacterium]
MKFLPLYDLQKEINRLFIAGSKFAKNDPRLQKQAVVFAKLGEKSPVFKKVAEGIENLVNAESIYSSTKLLEISTLLYSILYTQGETVDTGQKETELEPVMPLKEAYTNKSYLALKPLIEILTSQKAGRMRDMEMIFENRQFNDFRIYHLFDAALADNHAGFAEYIETTVIPAIGKPMIPFIINGFSLEGKPDDVRRFRILHKLGFYGIFEMADKVLTGESSVALQAEAVKALGAEVSISGGNSGNEELLIKFTGDKLKAMRLAAYEALANLNTETAQRTLVELFISGKKKQDIPELSKVLKINLLDKFIPALLEKAKADYRKCIEFNKSSDWKTIIDAFEDLKTSIIPLLSNVNEDIIAFFKDMFTDKKYIMLTQVAESRASNSYPHKQIKEYVATSLENTKEGFECLVFLMENVYCDEFLYSGFRASVKNKTDKKTIYEYFAKHFSKLLDYYQVSLGGDIVAEVFLDENGNPNTDYIDDRWKKLFAGKFSKQKNIPFKLAKVYIGLLDEKSKELQSFLSTAVNSYTVINDSFDSLAGLLIDSGHPEAFEIIFKAISAMITKRQYIPCDELLTKFPKEYAAKFRKIGDKLKTNNQYGANRHEYIANIIDR